MLLIRLYKTAAPAKRQNASKTICTSRLSISFFAEIEANPWTQPSVLMPSASSGQMVAFARGIWGSDVQEVCRGLRACGVGVLEEGAELRMLLQSCIAVGNALRLGRLCRGLARTRRGTCTNVKKVTGSSHTTDRTSHNSYDVLSSKTAKFLCAKCPITAVGTLFTAQKWTPSACQRPHQLKSEESLGLIWGSHCCKWAVYFVEGIDGRHLWRWV